MRITQQIIFNNSLRQINQNLSRLQDTYNQASSGKRLHKPSDDPYLVGKSFGLNQVFQRNEQFERNTNEARFWLEETEQNINGMVKVMQRIRELAIQGKNDTANEHDRAAITSEINELKEQLRNFANAKVNGDYLFNGQSIDQEPFPNELQFENTSFDTSPKIISISDGVDVQVNVTLDQLFGNPEDEMNLFATLDSLTEAINSGKDIPLEELDGGIERLLSVQSQLGARMNRVDAIANRVQDSQIEIQSMLSKIEDIDYSETLIKFTSEQNIYQASLMASSRIMQQSLMDFLR